MKQDAKPTVDVELKVIGQHFNNLWYGKLVRGAYMDRERYLAKKNGLPSPICDSYEETSRSYDLYFFN